MPRLYLTPGKLLSIGLGNDLDGLDQSTLSALCSQATRFVDAYCNVPRMPQLHDFRGGQITDEIHGWKYPQTPFDLGQRRIYIMHRPLISVDYLRIYVSNQPLYLEIKPENLVLNPTQNYMEIVALALTTSGVFNALIVPNVGLLAPIVKVGYRYGYRFDISGETLYETDGFTFRAENQWWFTSPAPVIYVNGEAISSGFTIDYDEGTVVFDADHQPAADEVVTADYSHKLPTDVMMGTAYVAHWLASGIDVHEKGLDRLTTIKMAEITLDRREMRGRGVATGMEDHVPPEIAVYLAAYRGDSLVVR